jgi:SH3-like domain-containing protein
MFIGEMMRRYKARLLIIILLIGGFSWVGLTSTVPLNAHAQQPTVSIPTVTSSPFGPMVTVNQDQEQINVRAGPSQDYPIVGVLEQGEKVPALGRSVGGDWVEIAYPVVDGGVAWVYAYLVTISGGELTIIVPPPTPTPRVTPTIDPTLAAQLIVEIGPTRLPTFTQPPPLEIPAYTQAHPR